MNGTVASWFARRNYGFIQLDRSPDEIFVHVSDLPDRKPIPVGTPVTFEVIDYAGRPKATRVQVRQ